MKRQLKLSVVAAVALGICGWLVAIFSVCAATSPTPLPSQHPAPVAAKPAQSPVSVRPAVLVARTEVPASNLRVLDERHQQALGMIETGNDDNEIGGAGEVSRYQIMPSVWRHYSDSQEYTDPRVSLQVARQHWASLYSAFKQQAHREPSDFDMYVLWNTHYGYYASRNFNPNRIAAVVRDRAQRYVNLVQDGEI